MRHPASMRIGGHYSPAYSAYNYANQQAPQAKKQGVSTQAKKPAALPPIPPPPGVESQAFPVMPPAPPQRKRLPSLQKPQTFEQYRKEAADPKTRKSRRREGQQALTQAFQKGSAKELPTARREELRNRFQQLMNHLGK